jgi:hypothetical protein
MLCGFLGNVVDRVPPCSQGYLVKWSYMTVNVNSNSMSSHSSEEGHNVQLVAGLLLYIVKVFLITLVLTQCWSINPADVYS